MKSSVLFILLATSLCSYSQTYNSSCIPSGNMESIYRNDVYRLATKRVNDINSNWKDSVDIPQIYRDSIARAIYAIHSMQAPVGDTITALFGYTNFNNFYGSDSSHIHSAGAGWGFNYRLKSLSLTVLNAAPWASDWAAGNFGNTNNDLINYLINRYDLHVVLSTVQIYNDKKVYHINSSAALNLPALTMQFQSIAGVVYANQEYYPGGGNYIDLSVIGGDYYLTYTVGCGDCPLGCTYGRTWQFKVNAATDCSVEYLSVTDWGIVIVMPQEWECITGVMPVKFHSIQVSEKNGYQLVQWRMEMEENVDEYIIERSPDGISYQPIGHVNIQTISTGPVNYSWNDYERISGKHFYRIKVVERSGAVFYSTVAALEIKLKGIKIFPTLVSDNLINIQFDNTGVESYQIDIIDPMGSGVFSSRMNVTTINQKELLWIPDIADGIYYLIIHNKSKRITQRILIVQ